MPLLTRDVLPSKRAEWYKYADSPRDGRFKIPMLVDGGTPYYCGFSINDFDRKYVFKQTFSFINASGSRYITGYWLTDQNESQYYISSGNLIESLKIAKVENGLITATWTYSKHDSKVSLKAVAP